MKLLFTDSTNYEGLIIQLNDKQSERLEDYVLMDGSLSVFHLLKTEKDILWQLENTFNIYFEGVETTNKSKRSTRELRLLNDFEVQAFNTIKTYA
tara:strand:+ start:326 stop:610 length:285 start_codon:yes stop_codon:yes gene_type:complete